MFSRSMRRFIPAGAGNTIWRCFSVSVLTVYPRWRGEHFRYAFLLSVVRGLSPLARGTHPCLVMAVKILRFIPAGAGNTKQHCCYVCRSTVYPRWRGEHTPSQYDSVLTPGLSPLARGTLWLELEWPVSLRFIPAGAGNTLTETGGNWCQSVYPRWRGEHLSHKLALLRLAGLSPLARGTQRCDHADSR